MAMPVTPTALSSPTFLSPKACRAADCQNHRRPGGYQRTLLSHRLLRCNFVDAARRHGDIALGDLSCGGGGRVRQVVVASICPADGYAGHANRLILAHVFIAKACRAADSQYIAAQAVSTYVTVASVVALYTLLTPLAVTCDVALGDISCGGGGRVRQVVVASICAADAMPVTTNRLILAPRFIAKARRAADCQYIAAQASIAVRYCRVSCCSCTPY